MLMEIYIYITVAEGDVVQNKILGSVQMGVQVLHLFNGKSMFHNIIDVDQDISFCGT